MKGKGRGLVGRKRKFEGKEGEGEKIGKEMEGSEKERKDRKDRKERGMEEPRETGKN